VTGKFIGVGQAKRDTIPVKKPADARYTIILFVERDQQSFFSPDKMQIHHSLF
jgi:hypothetical protein